MGGPGCRTSTTPEQDGDCFRRPSGAEGRLGGAAGSPGQNLCPRTMKIKRSSEKEAEGPSPKHFISEEAMSARFTCLSLGNDHVYSNNGFPVSRIPVLAASQEMEDRLGLPTETGPTGGQVELDGLYDMDDSRVLVMLPVLQGEMVQPLDGILPPALLPSVNGPCGVPDPAGNSRPP